MTSKRSKGRKPDAPKAKEKQTDKRARLLFQAAVTGVILVVYALLLAHEINLTVGDLGRHLKNGQLFVESGSIPNTNLYSYTYPDYPFINHHWGSGVIFYLIQRLADFSGLSICFLVISVLTLFLYLNVASKYSSFPVAASLAVLAIPVLIVRHEVRPEIFSYLLAGLFLNILWGYKYGRLGFNRLLLLPLLEACWVNLHIYFFIGVTLIAVFLFESLVTLLKKGGQERRTQSKQLGVTLLLTVGGTCLNPAGVSGAIYPFLILNEYEFPVIENYSVPSVLKAGFVFLPLIYFEILFGLLCVSWLYAFVKNRASLSLGNFLLTLFFSGLGWWAIRNFALFAYFALPFAAVNLSNLRPYDSPRSMLRVSATLAAISIGLILINPVYFFSSGRGRLGFSLKEGNDAAAQFFRSENLQGPVFNNYDVGSYLIYHLYPRRRVFVDNRPEAYPAAFFRDVYFPLQTHDDRWIEGSSVYGFNVIVFNHRDRSAASEQFLVRRVFDPAWAPVFFDRDILILVRRYGPNHSVIDRHELSKESVLMKTN
jgi:hypothetical protein